jgi:maleate isomerase
MTGMNQTVRARYGLIIPSSNRMAEPHAFAYTPQGVVPHTNRLRMTGPHAMSTADLLPKVREAAAMLADAKCDPIVFHCTANSMAGGQDGEAAITAAIEEATGKKAVTTASAALAALQALGTQSISLVSPYQRKSHEHEIEFLHHAGIEVVAEHNLDLDGSDAYCGMPAKDWLDAVAAVKNDRAGACFVSCANIRATEIIPQLEQSLGCPVITSNQVIIWRALRLAGIDDSLPALGSLGSL